MKYILLTLMIVAASFANADYHVSINNLSNYTLNFQALPAEAVDCGLPNKDVGYSGVVDSGANGSISAYFYEYDPAYGACDLHWNIIGLNQGVSMVFGTLTLHYHAVRDSFVTIDLSHEGQSSIKVIEDHRFGHGEFGISIASVE